MYHCVLQIIGARRDKAKTPQHSRGHHCSAQDTPNIITKCIVSYQNKSKNIDQFTNAEKQGNLISVVYGNLYCYLWFFFLLSHPEYIFKISFRSLNK